MSGKRAESVWLAARKRTGSWEGARRRDAAGTMCVGNEEGARLVLYDEVGRCEHEAVVCYTSLSRRGGTGRRWVTSTTEQNWLRAVMLPRLMKKEFVLHSKEFSSPGVIVSRLFIRPS